MKKEKSVQNAENSKVQVGALRFIQKFGDGCNITTMMCDEDCASRSIAMWADEVNHGFAWCEKHRKEHGAPEPIPGIEYAPAMNLMDR